MDFKSVLARSLADKSPRSCTNSELSALEERYHVTFPDDYREFLLLAGNGANDLWRGSDFTLNMLPDMQEAAAELLGESNLRLPAGSFVFFMHQGYQFFFLNPGGVFFFLEGSHEFEKRHGSFAEFFVATVDEL